MAYDKHLSGVIQSNNLGALKHDDRFSSQPPTGYGSLKKQPAISFHYVGQTHRKPVLCPDCPDQYWTVFLDYYVGGNEEYFNALNKVMVWVGVDNEPDVEGDNPRTAAVAKAVAINLRNEQEQEQEHHEFTREHEMAQWREWARTVS